MIHVKPSSARFWEKTSSTFDPRRFASVSRAAGSTSPEIERRIVEDVAALDLLLEADGVEADRAADDSEDLAGQEPGEAFPRRSGAALGSEEPRLRDLVVQAGRERRHLALAGPGRGTTKVDADGHVANPRLSGEGHLWRDGARVIQLDDEPLDAIGIATEVDLAAIRRLQSAEHARACCRADQANRRTNVEPSVVVVDAQITRGRDGDVEAQTRQPVGRRRGPGDSAGRRQPQQLAAEDERLAIGATEHIDAAAQLEFAAPSASSMSAFDSVWSPDG